jgi:hypothetical protein
VKIFNGIFAILFGLFENLQYNALDPLIWMGIYGLGALICFLAFFGRDNLIWYYT